MQSSLPGQRGQGELHLQLIYKPFEDEEDETDNMYKQAEVFALARQEQTITDVKSAAGAPYIPQHSLTAPAHQFHVFLVSSISWFFDHIRASMVLKH